METAYLRFNNWNDERLTPLLILAFKRALNINVSLSDEEKVLVISEKGVYNYSTITIK